MYTQEQITERLVSLTEQRERLSTEVTLLDYVIAFWEEQLDQHKALTVHHTYTDTPMAEEYYRGWTVDLT